MRKTKSIINFRAQQMRFLIFSSLSDMSWLNVFLLLHLFLPANFALHNKTYGKLEFISPVDPASFSSAQAWCKHHGSTLAEITNERVWNLTIMIDNEFNLRTRHIILNAEGRELPDWQWITGEMFIDEGNYYSLRNDTRMFAHISKPSMDSTSISIVGSLQKCDGGPCKHSYVCERDTDSSCDIQGVNINSTCIDGVVYIFHHSQYVTWFEALNNCSRSNGRLATFRNIKTDERQIASQIQRGNNYWIGLHRYEWKWADSEQLITYANWAMYHPFHNDSCVHVSFISQNWMSHNKCTADDMHTFVCIRDVTICASNPCQNGATCVSSTRNYTCRCASGFTGSLCESAHRHECVSNSCENGATCQDSVNNVTCLCLPGFTGSRCHTEINECDNNPCQNGGSCVGSINNHTCSCPLGFTGSKCQSSSNQTVGFSGIQILVIIVLAIILVTLIIILPVIIYKRIYKTRESNDAGLSSKHGTTIESATQHARENEYDEKDGVGTGYVNTASCIECGIYGQVVTSQNDDQRNTTTSSSLVYADLEFSQQIMQVETHSDPAPETQPPSSCTGPMGDVYAMVEK